MDRTISIIRARLDQLGVTPYKASVRSGHRPTWLGQMLLKGRVSRRDVLREVAEALGVTVAVLEGLEQLPEWSPPAWLVDDLQRAKAPDMSLPVCPICGRHRKLVAKGLCMACWQRARRKSRRDATQHGQTEAASPA